MTFAEMLTALKSECSISGTTFDTFLKQQLNFGQSDFCRAINLPFQETRGSLSIVANKYIYDLPSNFDTLRNCIFEQRFKLRSRNKTQWAELMKFDNVSTILQFYILKEGKLWVYPTPSAAAATTTLDGGINANATTIKLTSTSGLKNKGRGLIGSEVIEWQFINSSRELLNCRRGLELTTAASANDSDAFTYRNLAFDYFKAPAEMSADADVSIISAEYHEAPILYAKYKFFMKQATTGSDRLLAQVHFDNYNILKGQAQADLGEKEVDSFSTVLDDSSTRAVIRDNTFPQRGSLS